jgi:HAD superfamily hydrolase (TIGR01509 family)
VISAHFAYQLPEFWRRVLHDIGLALPDTEIDKLALEHERVRRNTAAPVHDAIPEILQAARVAGLAVGVVSNNPTADIEDMLVLAGLGDHMDVVIGTDAPGFAAKPAPDPYLRAAEALGLPPERCVAVEDSLLGVESASRAGCYTVGVATGSASFDELTTSPFVSRTYLDFRAGIVELGDRGVTDKSLVTPNDFVSHMVEHIAWRLGCSVEVSWASDDWFALGAALGREVARLSRGRTSAAALGMIDDGSAEVAVHTADDGKATLTATQQVDLDWFIGLRCEQLPDGQPLVEMLSGLCDGGGFDLNIRVASLEDPHHTWEGVYRAVGIALSKMRVVDASDDAGDEEQVTNVAGAAVEERAVERGWVVEHVSTRAARLSRRTAESKVEIGVALGGPDVRFRLEVGKTINVDGMADLLRELAAGANLELDVSFLATRLSSSHVVTEDIGLALGRAIRGIAVERMERVGIHGAGSSVSTPADLNEKPVRVGVSMEGRKFWKYVPFQQDYAEFRRDFLVGHTLPNGLFSEDLDDFVDGLAGGMHASVMVHFDRPVGPSLGWPMVFRGLGESIAELLSPNPGRRGLIAGVKATLA